MKANRKDLVNALSKLNKLKECKALQITENVSLTSQNGMLEMVKTDLETYYGVKIPFEGVINTTVNQIDLLKLLQKVKSEIITFEQQDGNLLIIHDKGTFKLATTCINEFPKLEESEFIFVTELDFVSELNKVAKYVGKDDFRPAQKGVFFDYKENSLKLCATDANKLVTCEVKEIEHFVPFITPITKVGFFEGSLFQSYKYIKIESANEWLVMRKIDANYPNYEAVIPQEGDSVRVDKESLLEAIEVVSLCANETTQKIEFDFVNSNIKAEDLDYSKEAIYSLQMITESDITIYLSAKYLLEIIKDIQDKEVYLEVTSPTRAVLFKENNFVYLVMPQNK